MEALDLVPRTSTAAPVLVLQFDAARYGDYQRIARTLREAGIGTEVYPDAKKLGQQFQYAERRGFRVGLIAGSNEFDQGVWKVKNLATKEETAVRDADLVAAVQKLLETNRKGT
jgi:histidyl-tRNA synthetase